MTLFCCKNKGQGLASVWISEMCWGLFCIQYSHFDFINVLCSNAPSPPATPNVGGGSKIGTDFDTAAKVVQRDIDGDCPICYEKMVADGGKGKKEPIVFCKACGNNVHRDCFERWSRSKRSSRGKVTCIYCRAEWVDDNKGGHNSNKVEPGGYVNLASYSENHGTEGCSLEALYPDSYEWLGLAARRRQSRS